ncbi:protein of unknown function [Streptantibioticus cattleyicolor NRRL 8057 = DSM 46488]|nr:protein of unknown function [Streptantibioticus cattleyicolor NRRL 8057 = DSM 46488]
MGPWCSLPCGRRRGPCHARPSRLRPGRRRRHRAEPRPALPRKDPLLANVVRWPLRGSLQPYAKVAVSARAGGHPFTSPGAPGPRLVVAGVTDVSPRPPVAVFVQCGVRTVFLGFRGPSGVTPRSTYPPRLGSGCWVAAGTPLHAPVLLRSALRHGVGEKEIGVTPTSSLTPTREERHPHDGTRGCAGGVPAATQQPERNCGGYAERGVTPGAPPTPYRQ